jgi:hypothetical protein
MTARVIDRATLTHEEDKCTVTLVVYFEDRNIKERDLDLHQVKQFRTVQCYGTIAIAGTDTESGNITTTLSDPNFLSSATLQRLGVLLDYWRGNDMRNGTRKQFAVLRNVPRWRSLSYTEQCVMLRAKKLLVDRGFEYGRGWLVEPMPPEVEFEIRGLVTDLGGKFEQVTA